MHLPAVQPPNGLAATPSTPLRAQPTLQQQQHQQQPTIATPEQPASAQPQHQPRTGALPQVRLCFSFLKQHLRASGAAHLQDLHQAGAALAEAAGLQLQCTSGHLRL